MLLFLGFFVFFVIFSVVFSCLFSFFLLLCFLFVETSRSYHTLLWRDVADRFNLARTLLKQLPGHLTAHAWAVVCGHVVSQAQYHGDPTRDRTDRDHFCWSCQKEIIPSFLHAMWECDAPQFAERPSLPTCNLQLCLGWPDPTKGHAQNTEVLVHMAEVRRDLPSMRWR